MSLIAIFITSILSQNIILTKFLGIYPLITVSNKEKGAVGMGLIVTIVTMISTLITYLINQYILIPTDSTYLQTLVFIFIIACFVQIVELIIKKHFKWLYELLSADFSLIIINCAVLGVILINVKNSYSLVESLIFALGSSIGFVLIIYILANIRERLNKSPIIKSFRGVPIALITVGIIALIFARFGA